MIFTSTIPVTGEVDSSGEVEQWLFCCFCGDENTTERNIRIIVGHYKHPNEPIRWNSMSLLKIL